MLSVCIMTAGVAIFSSYAQVKLLEEARWGGNVHPEIADANDTRQIIVAVASLGFTIITAIAFFMWLHRAHRNLPALQAEELAYTPGWAVGYWFVPFLNLVRPCQIMLELHRESDPARVAPFRSATSGALIVFWWAAWLLGGILAQISLRMTIYGMTKNGIQVIDSLLAATWVDIGSDAFVIAAGLSLIFIVAGIDSAQTNRHRKLGKASAPPQPVWIPPGMK
jgi:hypothetical protein